MTRLLLFTLLLFGCAPPPATVPVAPVPLGPPRGLADYRVAWTSHFSDQQGAWGPLDPANGLYIACWHLPRGTPIEFRAEGVVCTATVQDRGPARRLVRRGRVWDMSPKLFGKFWPHRNGIGRVAAKVIGEAK